MSSVDFCFPSCVHLLRLFCALPAVSSPTRSLASVRSEIWFHISTMRKHNMQLKFVSELTDEQKSPPHAVNHGQAHAGAGPEPSVRQSDDRCFGISIYRSPPPVGTPHPPDFTTQPWYSMSNMLWKKAATMRTAASVETCFYQKCNCGHNKASVPAPVTWLPHMKMSQDVHSL